MKFSSLHKNIQLLYWFNFLLDFRLYSAVVIIYFIQITGSFTLGMSIFSITMISSAIFEVPTGIFSDLIGRKKTLVFGAVGSVLSVICYASGGSYIILAIGAVFEGLARSFYSGNNDAFLIDTLAESNQEGEYAAFLGHTSAMFQWALAISAVVGGVIASYSFSLVMWLSVIPTILGFIISLYMVEPKVHKEITSNIYSHLQKALRIFKQNYNLRLLCMVDILTYAQGEAGYQFRSAFINTIWPLWAVGVAKMLSNIGAAISFHISGAIIEKYKPFPVVIFAKLYAFISNVIATAYPTFFSPVLLSTTSLSYGSSSVAMSSLLQQEYSTQQRSTMGSLNSLFGSIGFAITALGLGFIADKLDPAMALLSLQVLSLFSIVLLWYVFKRRVVR